MNKENLSNNTQTKEVLSNDLNIITSEIRGYQNMAGKAVFEIGKRLKWVKDHDLAHGEWLTWLESMNIGDSFARRSIQIYSELGNSNQALAPDLNMSVLYEIATLPPEERNHEHLTQDGEFKQPEDMTRKEIRDLKKQLKEARDDQKNTEKTLAEEREQKAQEIYKLKQDLDSNKNTLDILNNQLEIDRKSYEDQLKKVQEATNTEIVEQIVEPDDYEELKRKIKTDEIRLSGYEQENSELYKEVEILHDRAAKYAKTEEDYQHKLENVDRLKTTIDNLKEQKELRHQVVKTVNQGLVAVNQMQKLVDTLDLTNFDEYDPALADLSKIANKTEHVVNELRDKLATEYSI